MSGAVPLAKEQVQSLALTGFNDACVRHCLLRFDEGTAAQARRFIGELVKSGLLAFGERDRNVANDGQARVPKINIGFSHQGLVRLGAPADLLALLANRSPAFCKGAFLRASAHLGDTGPSAPDRWDAIFREDRVHLWISIHGADQAQIEKTLGSLRGLPGAAALHGFDDETGLSGRFIEDPPPDDKVRRVHFGFRDSITKPRIDGEADSPAAGELLIGFPNNDKVDPWTEPSRTSTDLAAFLRHGSFGILRKIQQFELSFDAYLNDTAAALHADHPWITPAYLKAKMCGRWPNGTPVRPGQIAAPLLSARDALPAIDFSSDEQGIGCPFGAHIRRANPRTDPIVPKQMHIHTLFRRGVPYGKPVDPATEKKGSEHDRGLLGVFFCARIEDQFERLISEWLQKKPMGPLNRGHSKDPLVGQHDEPDAGFIIPMPDGKSIELKGFEPFVRTRGTLYALFPSLQALRAISSWEPAKSARAPSNATDPGRSGARPSAFASSSAEPDFMDVPGDRFCDVVMEGGVTSGVIYASAAVGLARHYRFRNIGGSSIGAFAAAITAAAELRRRKGFGDGFDRFGALPERLAETDQGKTLLERLFVPNPKTRRLFGIFHASLERSSAASLVLHGIRAALREYLALVLGAAFVLFVVALAGFASTLAPCQFCAPPTSRLDGAGAWLLAFLLSLPGGVTLALLAGVAWDLIHGLVPNGFGLCRGWGVEPKSDTPELAVFLHGAIQQTAGLGIDELPLCFRDLWDAPGAPLEALGLQVHASGDAHSINLQVYASNLAHSRPYRFPQDENEDPARLYFRRDEMELYFPKGIVQYMLAVATPWSARMADGGSNAGPTDGYFELPSDRLPVVVAVRLAMSFPLLISAVKLYAFDPVRKRMEPCWMSDGGLCSNFPIHLFDCFVPKWPTFGISLQTREKQGQPGSDPHVWLPRFHSSGRGEIWDRGPSDSPSALGKLGAFLASIWTTTWRWNDSTLMRMPGVRDRVVRIYLDKDEGGVNIRMKPDKIRLLGEQYGKAAADAFIAKFARATSKGWQEHRWVRMCCLMIALRDRITGLAQSIDLDRHTMPLTQQIAQSQKEPPLSKPDGRDRVWPSEAVLTHAQAGELHEQLLALRRLEDAFNRAGDHRPYHAIPRPVMRTRPPT